MPDWTCPKCGQRFLHRNRGHSCQTQSVEALFAGQPGAIRLRQHVSQVIEDLGPAEAAVTKSQTSFRVPGGTRFCWVWRPPEGVKGVPEGGIVLTFDLPRRLVSARIKEVVEPRPGRFTHHLVLENVAQLNTEVVDWLRDARQAAAKRPKRLL